MRTRKIQTVRRFWGSDEERYKVEITLLCSQDELEKVTQFIQGEGKKNA